MNAGLDLDLLILQNVVPAMQLSQLSISSIPVKTLKGCGHFTHKFLDRMLGTSMMS